MMDNNFESLKKIEMGVKNDIIEVKRLKPFGSLSSSELFEIKGGKIDKTKASTFDPKTGLDDYIEDVASSFC
jgi:hypothetical protein